MVSASNDLRSAVKEFVLVFRPSISDKDLEEFVARVADELAEEETHPDASTGQLPSESVERATTAEAAGQDLTDTASDSKTEHFDEPVKHGSWWRRL